ncbi:MAG TPA: tryptophan synthase subunit alpha [Spirochaetota bacterium]|nr:tryptophan synthase subunit alpha [Spirochaetota bacterium]HPC42144.1 tryptophan synthase subunit alpha [Spirochaetota bacterium]HQF09684.1 tryptophan synthase subunit alpha [Spirochaetota bacterium]HQH98438.1 tryptophan synthase subunit alpha [Spirochaetota bacterium]HQJ72199.1 tryptophan synthase subunit alpha [Spirochaetota bacterium]
MRGIYLAGGYPDAGTFKKCFNAVVKNGFDFIEIGIPFNDPTADGPVIARAIQTTLESGITPANVMEEILSQRGTTIKKYVMTYANIIYSYGMREFSERMAGCIDGVIIPDLPNRMAPLFYDSGFDIPIVPFATLESRESDIEVMNRSTSEIIYFIGVRGITGSKSDFTSPELLDKIRMIRENTYKKVIIGFGVKTADDARQALAIGDGYVVGTEAVLRQQDPAALDRYLQSLNHR